MLGWFCTLSEPSSCALNSSRGACLQEFSCLCLKWVLASIISPHQMVLCQWLAVLIRHWGTPLPSSIPSSSLLGREEWEAPRMGEMSPWGQLQHLGLFHTHTNGGRRNSICVYCRLSLPIPLILGSQGSSIIYSWVSVVVVGTWPQKTAGHGSVHGAEWLWCCAGFSDLQTTEPQSMYWREPYTIWYGMSQPLLRVRTLLGPSTHKNMQNPNFAYTDQN